MVLGDSDPLVVRVRELRAEIGEKLREELEAESDMAREQGRFPYHGIYLSREEVEKLDEQLRRRSRIALLEVGALLLTLLSLSAVFYGAIYLFIPT